MADFECIRCQKTFRWSPALAGRRVRCSCGHVFNCPADSQDLYDLAPADVALASATRPPVSEPSRAPAVLSYRIAQNAPSAKADPEAIKNLHMPLWLLGGGVAVEIIAAFVRRRHNIELALIQVGAELILGTAFMLAGMLLAARLRGIDLGKFWKAVFKLSAISVAPSAAVAIFTPALRLIPLGGLLGWAGEFVLYFALLGVLFDLDESDTWYCVCVIFLLKLGVFFALLWLALHV